MPMTHSEYVGLSYLWKEGPQTCGCDEAPETTRIPKRNSGVPMSAGPAEKEDEAKATRTFSSSSLLHRHWGTGLFQRLEA